jgi:transcriptional regulator with XRE-family HTH domain
MSATGFAAMLKALREKAGFNQQELADRLGVDQASVSRWENGISEPGISMARPLAAALGVSIESLMPEPKSDKPNGRRKPKK